MFDITERSKWFQWFFNFIVKLKFNPKYQDNQKGAIYLLDEPTVGLHYDDVHKLLEVLNKLVVHGNTVVLIEHNLDIVKSSDYIIDIGPEGGVNGGNIVAKGTPEEVANNLKSYTGKYLKRVLRK